MDLTSFKFSCVLDESPLMSVQSFIWLNSLLANNIPPANIFIHVIEDLPREYHDYLRDKGINLIECEVFDVRNRYCNKLVQFSTFEKRNDFEYVFLMDCDTAVINLEGLELSQNIYSKIVDFPNPPFNILEQIFSNEGLTIGKKESSFSVNGKNITDWNNCNGGLYIIRKDFLTRLAPSWKKYTLRCIENREVFTQRYEKHADQVGFALAMASLGEKVSHLNIEWNFPVHIDVTKSESSPKIIHFHNKIDNQLKIIKTDNIQVDQEIETLNKVISRAIRGHHLNSIFWNYRYKVFPELGSGIGSRGEILKYKKEVLKKHLPLSEKLSIIDVGCGDLKIIEDFQFDSYLGIDVSREIIKQAKEKKPEWNFKLVQAPKFKLEKKDVVICLDVLIHQNNYQDYLALVKTLIYHTKQRLIVAAYDSPPTLVSDITFYFEPITETLKSLGGFKEIFEIGEYRSTSIVVADTNECEISGKDNTKKKGVLRKLFHAFSK